jgi:hypothetical protein
MFLIYSTVLPNKWKKPNAEPPCQPLIDAVTGDVKRGFTSPVSFSLRS